jgi:hypothetical protein
MIALTGSYCAVSDSGSLFKPEVTTRTKLSIYIGPDSWAFNESFKIVDQLDSGVQ